MQSVILHRVVIYPKDVMNITGYSQRSARKLLVAIRKANGKGHGTFVTITEFSAHTGISEAVVRPFLR